jgi:hypothetical protein
MPTEPASPPKARRLHRLLESPTAPVIAAVASWQLATKAELDSPASLALCLEVAEREAGWRVAGIAGVSGRALVELEQATKPLSRPELVALIRRHRAAGLSYRQVARQLERDGIAAPGGGMTW